MRDELDVLIEQELDKLYRFVYRRVGDSYRAEDITQEIVLQAYRAYPRLQNRERLTPWLWGIANNMVARSYRLSPEISTDEVTIVDLAGASYETPATEYLRRQDILRVRRALSYLAKMYRDVCVLYYLEDKDYNTIARELNIPLSSVKWRLNQSKSQLREELEKMEYMEHGYRRAKPLLLNMGGWYGKPDPAKGAYDNADKVLQNSLLAQNICQVAYREAKTVSDIASELGVAADYVEAELERIVPTQAMRRVGNRYQTMFPIWDVATNRDVFVGNISFAEQACGEVIDLLLSCADRIARAGFYGCEWGMDRLILFLVGYMCINVEHNTFETEKLPFHGTDKAWYLLGTTDKSFGDRGCVGINSAGSMFGLREYSFVAEDLEDQRSMNSAYQRCFYDVCLGKTPAKEEPLAALLESGKIVRVGDTYRPNVPVLRAAEGDEERLNQAIAPALEKLNEMQKKLYVRSMETVSKHIPAHIADQREFFGGYCCHSVPELVLYRELRKRGVPMTDLMGVWFTIKDTPSNFDHQRGKL